MIEALVVYDSTGYIIHQEFGGAAREPVGVPFLKVEIPNGKYVSGVDVSEETPKVILKDMAKSVSETEIELLKEEQDLMKKAIEELILGGAL